VDKKAYATVEIDRGAIEAASKDEGAFIKAAKQSIRKAFLAECRIANEEAFSDGTAHGGKHMNNLPKELYAGTAVEATSASNDLAVQQAQSLAVLAKGINDIAAFLTGGGLGALVSGYAKSQSIQAILGGLAAHDGRNALDARVLGQNAIEVAEQVMKVFDKMAERVNEKGRDPEIHKAVEPSGD
jgi:hypothetical protein